MAEPVTVLTVTVVRRVMFEAPINGFRTIIVTNAVDYTGSTDPKIGLTDVSKPAKKVVLVPHYLNVSGFTEATTTSTYEDF